MEQKNISYAKHKGNGTFFLNHFIKKKPVETGSFLKQTFHELWNVKFKNEYHLLIFSYCLIISLLIKSVSVYTDIR